LAITSLRDGEVTKRRHGYQNYFSRSGHGPKTEEFRGQSFMDIHADTLAKQKIAQSKIGSLCLDPHAKEAKLWRIVVKVTFRLSGHDFSRKPRRHPANTRPLNGLWGREK
jgi:hypothetical protein